jgi:hypothetical protein
VRGWGVREGGEGGGEGGREAVGPGTAR